MALMRWEPSGELSTLHDRINRLFEEAWGPISRRVMPESFTPALEVHETEKELVVKAEIPDMNEKDLEVNIENNMLTIRGERKEEFEEKKGTYHMSELSYGSFVRSLTLPPYVETEKSTAKYDRGVLRISFPKKEGVKPKRIDIKLH